MEYKLTLEGPGFKTTCTIAFSGVPEDFNGRSHPGHMNIVRTLCHNLTSREMYQLENTLWNEDRDLYRRTFLLGEGVELCGMESKSEPEISKDFP